MLQGLQLWVWSREDIRKSERWGVKSVFVSYLFTYQLVPLGYFIPRQDRPFTLENGMFIPTSRLVVRVKLNKGNNASFHSSVQSDYKHLTKCFADDTLSNSQNNCANYY